MAIGFNGIPNDLRVPMCYIEFDSSGAVKGTPAPAWKQLLIGQALQSADSANLLNPIRLTSPAQAARLFGEGSMMALMYAAAHKANSYLETWVIAMADPVAGSAASTALTIKSAATQAGVIYLMVAGQQIQVGVKKGDTPDIIALSMIASIAATPSLPVTAALDPEAADTVVLTAKHKGEVGNSLCIIPNYHAGQSLPDGVTLEFEPNLSGGAGNPDITDAIAVMGSEWWRGVVMPYTDADNMLKFEQELDLRWSPMQMNDSLTFTAFRGSLGATAAFGDSHNGHLISCIGTGFAPQPSWLWAAVYGTVAGSSLSIDPARPLQTLTLIGLLPPPKPLQWERSECELLLKDGIATHQVNGTEVQIQREITMYQEDKYGAPDPSYLDVTTPATLSYIRYATTQRMQKLFPRHKLASDGTRFGAGQPIVTPSIIRSQLLALFTEFEEQGLVEDFKNYQETLIVERDANDQSRVNVLGHPDLVNGFRIYAEQIQFIV